MDPVNTLFLNLVSGFSNKEGIFFLCSVSPFIVCVQQASFMCMRHLFSVSGEFQVPPIGLEYEIKRIESFPMDSFGRKYSWNDSKEDGAKELFWCMWTWPMISEWDSTFHSSAQGNLSLVSSSFQKDIENNTQYLWITFLLLTQCTYL